MALIKSLNILLLGLVAIATCSEDELVNFLLSIKLNKKYVLMVSIALNTFNFILQDIEITSESLTSRHYNESGLIQKMKKVYYIGANVVLSHIKKIQILTENFSIKEKYYR